MNLARIFLIGSMTAAQAEQVKCENDLDTEITAAGNIEAKRKRAIAKARRRFGQPFAHEEGSTWKPRATPVLTDWMASNRGDAA